MSRFIESIWFEDGNYPFLPYHQQRINRAFEAHFPEATSHDLLQVLPFPQVTGKYKVRVVYGKDSFDIEYAEYQKRKIQNVKIVYDDNIAYDHKYEDRSDLMKLYHQRGEADEIIIIKNGFVTDCHYFNIVFWDGIKWHTPSTNLLDGIMRKRLLDEGEITERPINDYEIPWFDKISLINALNDLGDIEISTDNILFD